MITQNIKAKKVGDLMSRNVLTGYVKNSFTYTLRLFSELPFHHLPIVNVKRELIGMISSNDIMKLLTVQLAMLNDFTEDALNNAVDISEIMSADPITVSPETTIKEALFLFCEHKIHALPVVEEKQLVGILTTNDLLKNSCK